MQYIIREALPGEAAYVADLHRRLYTDEYDWGEDFIAYAQKIALDFEKAPRSDREALFVVEARDSEAPEKTALAGCIMLCQTEDPDVGQLRLFAIEKDHRRQGLGRKLIERLFEKAREAQYKTIILWTAAPLEAALRQYERFGFRVTEKSENQSWSNKGAVVVEIKMQCDL